MKILQNVVTGLLFFLFPLISFAEIEVYQRYLPSHDSLSKHKNPDWYNDAKFGIMIHYGLYSVAGWAPLFDPSGKVGTKEFYLNNPYVAWYMNSMQIKDSPTYAYHLKTYGPNFTYDDFVPLFNQAAAHWNPENWADLFEKSGAKYVVFVTKHHDGFLLWHSRYRNPYKPQFVAQRDIVDELVPAVRAHHMRMGLYYSGGYDWSWAETPTPAITDFISSVKKLPETQAYADYVDNQWHELIQKYKPDLIWNDIALPAKIEKFKLFADYYNTVSDGILNNRWSQDISNFIVASQPTDAQINYQLHYDWFDYYTPEYLPHYQFTKHRWEADHGPGYGFEYNRNEYEHPDHLKNADEMLADLSDVVSKNGNLLLAIGPEADGAIPEFERNLLLEMGEWLNQNGEAIYATRPWKISEGTVDTGIEKISVRFTQSKNHDALYMILLKNPQHQNLLLENFIFDKKTQVQVLHGNKPIPLSWYQSGNNIQIILNYNKEISDKHLMALKITPEPTMAKSN